MNRPLTTEKLLSSEEMEDAEYILRLATVCESEAFPRRHNEGSPGFDNHDALASSCCFCGVAAACERGERD